MLSRHKVSIGLAMAVVLLTASQNVLHADSGVSWTDPDIVIDSAYDYQDVSVATRRSNGEIFIAASVKPTSDSRYWIYVYHSPDGINWQSFVTFGMSNGDCFNPSLNIFTADSEYLILAYERYDTTNGERNVRTYRRAFGSSSGTSAAISAYAGVAERDPSLCNSELQFPSNPWLYCAFVSGDSIGFARSMDYGSTWTHRQIIAEGGASFDYGYPSCAFGWHSSPDSMFLGVAWQYLADSKREIRFRKNTINGSPGYWHPTINFSCPQNMLDIYPNLQMTHGGYPSAVMTFVRVDTVGVDNADLYRFVTSNGGATWSDALPIYDATYAGMVAHSLVVDDSLGYYHVAYRGEGGHMFYQKARYDSISLEWSNAISFGFGSWDSYDFPAVGTRNGEPYVAWADYHAPVFKLKFDAQWLQTAVREQKSASLVNPLSVSPNPAKGVFAVNYPVNRAGTVRIAVYDALGRLAMNVLETDMPSGQYQTKITSENLAAGVYFISVETPEGIWNRRIAILR